MAYALLHQTLTILGNKTNQFPKKQVKTGTCIESSVTNLSSGFAAFQLILSSGRSYRPAEESPEPGTNFFVVFNLTLTSYESSVESGNLLCRFIYPSPISYLEHWSGFFLNYIVWSIVIKQKFKIFILTYMQRAKL